jgi:hypothetical protein
MKLINIENIYNEPVIKNAVRKDDLTNAMNKLKNNVENEGFKPVGWVLDSYPAVKGMSNEFEPAWDAIMRKYNLLIKQSLDDNRQYLMESHFGGSSDGHAYLKHIPFYTDPTSNSSSRFICLCVSTKKEKTK